LNDNGDISKQTKYSKMWPNLYEMVLSLHEKIIWWQKKSVLPKSNVFHEIQHLGLVSVAEESGSVYVPVESIITQTVSNCCCLMFVKL